MIWWPPEMRYTYIGKVKVDYQTLNGCSFPVLPATPS